MYRLTKCIVGEVFMLVLNDKENCTHSRFCKLFSESSAGVQGFRVN